MLLLDTVQVTQWAADLQACRYCACASLGAGGTAFLVLPCLVIRKKMTPLPSMTGTRADAGLLSLRRGSSLGNLHHVNGERLGTQIAAADRGHHAAGVLTMRTIVETGPTTAFGAFRRLRVLVSSLPNLMETWWTVGTRTQADQQAVRPRLTSNRVKVFMLEACPDAHHTTELYQ